MTQGQYFIRLDKLCIMPTVTIRRKGLSDYQQIWSQVFDDLGIWRLLQGKTKVLIKPNWVTYKSADTGVTTDVALVKSLVQMLTMDGRLEITVGESSLSDTGEVFSYLGVNELGQYGCRVVNFYEGQWISVASPLKLVLDRFLILETAYQAEVIFNLAKMKTHALTGVSLGLKNFLGMLSRGGRKVIHLRDIDKGILDVFAYFYESKVLISMIDGLVALEGERGPTHGNPVPMDCLFASDDPLLADFTCAQAMGVKGTEIRHLRLASQLGLRRRNPVVTLGVSIHNVARPFVMPRMPQGVGTPWDEWLVNKLFYKYPQVQDDLACVQCGECEEICPVGCAKLVQGSFAYRPSDCIHCLCCVEACTTGALGYEVKNRELYQPIRNMWRRIRAYQQQR